MSRDPRRRLRAAAAAAMQHLRHNGRNVPRAEAWRDEAGRLWLPLPLAG